jgi:hypothetical protein
MSLYNLLYPDNMGVHHFDGGGTVTPAATSATENTVSNWAAPVVGGIINAAVDYAANPYQVYGGNLVAGASDLQNKAFTGIQQLAQPNAAQTNATTNMQDVYTSAATQPGYVGSDFTKTGNALNQTAYGGGQDYTKVGTASTQPAYAGTKFTSNTAGINNQFDQTALDSYMNPYLSTILNPQLAEARRNAGTTQMKTDADLIRQGAFGGGRQAIAGAENARNLNMNLADITGKGYNTAYTAAQTQYNADQNRLLDALKAAEQSGQYGYTKDAERLAADRTALLDSLKAKELSNQYGYTKDAERLTNDRTALLDSLKAEEQAKQFGSKQGLDYLKLAGDTAQNQGVYGNQLADRALAANLREADLGSIQRDIEQQGLTSDYNLFKEQRDYPKTNIDWLNSIMKNYPMTTTNTYGEPTSMLNSILGGALTGTSILGTAADAVKKLGG